MYLSSASAAAFAVAMALEVGDTALAALHKSLELALEGIFLLFGSGLTGALLGRHGPLGLLLNSFFDRQIDTVRLIDANDLDFDSLSLGNVLADVADKGIGYLRNMNHTALARCKLNERSELGDTGDLTLINIADNDLHQKDDPPTTCLLA